MFLIEKKKFIKTFIVDLNIKSYIFNSLILLYKTVLIYNEKDNKINNISNIYFKQ